MAHKYNTLQDLRDAYQRDEQIGPLSVDDDTANVWESKGGQVVFDRPVAELLEEALDMLGIPHTPGMGRLS